MTQNKTLSVAVLSGKGGVGKTNMALNLGYCLNVGRHPLLLMDCDVGLANLDVLLGLAPEKNLHDLLYADALPEEVVTPIEPTGFDFLPAASGVPEFIEMDEDMRQTLFDKLSGVLGAYHYVFLDLGAGITPTILSFAGMARVRIMVVTPEPTSLTDSYAVIKVLATQHGVRDFHILVNQADNEAEGKRTFTRLNAACEKFLNLSVDLLGIVRYDKHVPDAVRKQQPLMKLSPGSDAAKDLFEAAKRLNALRNSLLPTIADEHPLKFVRPGAA